MEKILKIFLIIVMIGIIIVIGLGIRKIAQNMYKNGNLGLDSILSNMENTSHTMKAVVIKVNEKSLIVKSGSLYSCRFAKEGNIGFKMGQEILIYYDGMIFSTYPGQISNVGKIEILKEKSDIEISEDDMRYCYSNLDNVSVVINNFSNSGISYTITDNNKYKYEFSKTYVITKKNKEIEEENKLKEEINRNALEQQLEKDKEEYKEGRNFTTGFTPPETIEQVWEEAPKVSSVESEDTGSYSENGNTFTRTYDWTNLYGKLGEGEYKFRTSIKADAVIEIDFTIDKDGKLTYSNLTYR